MKKIIIIISVLVFANYLIAQDSGRVTENTISINDDVTTTENENELPKFALSFNPLGFVQFGPTLGAEVKLTSNVVLNIQTRFPTMGLLTYAIRDGVDDVSGGSFGFGGTHFFSERVNKPYVGLVIQFEKLNCIYNQGTELENTETEKTTVFMMNGGYRFNFSNKIFLNTGVFFGFAKNKWTETYKSSIYEGDKGSGMHPFGMLELTIGINL